MTGSMKGYVLYDIWSLSMYRVCCDAIFFCRCPPTLSIYTLHCVVVLYSFRLSLSATVPAIRGERTKSLSLCRIQYICSTNPNNDISFGNMCVFVADQTRQSWDKGDEVEIFSNTHQEWYLGEIVDIIKDEEGEWLNCVWARSNGEAMSKQVQRFSTDVRPVQV